MTGSELWCVHVFVEANELIASFLTDGNDLCRFTLLCHATHEAVH